MAASCVAFATAEAADLLRHGLHKKAAELLQSSLVTLRSQIHGGLEHVPDRHQAQTSALGVRSVNASDDSPHPSIRSCGAFEFFDRVFVLDDGIMELSETSPLSCYALNRLTVIVLYNMGVCYHLGGIQGHQPDSSMKKAIDLYQLAMWLMEITFDRADPADTRVYVAVLNNIGHAYQHQCDAANAQDCLRSLSGYLRAQSVDLGDRLAVARLDLEHFYFTVLLYDHVFPTASAA